jgi:hypothetical protein
MKRSTGLIVLLAVLVLAVVFYVIATVIAKREEEKNQEPEATVITVVDKKPEDVTSLTFESKTLSVGITVTESGKYRLTSDEHFPMDQIIASYMVEGVSVIEFTRKLEGADTDPATYGLDKPHTVITAAYTDDRTVTLKLGDYNKHADAYYCDMGDGGVYLIVAAYLDAFDYTMKDLLQDELITKPKEGLSAVTEFKLVFRDGSGFTYTFTKPAADEAAESEEATDTTDTEETTPKEYWAKTLLDGTVVEGDFTEQAEALYKELFEVKLDAWVNYNVTGAERLGEFGLAEPAVTVTVRYTEEVTLEGDENSSSVTKEVEKVVGFLIGDAAPSEEDEPADSESSAESAAPETDTATDTATDTSAPEGDAEEEEKIVNRYFMLEGGKVVYLLDEAKLTEALGIVAEPEA